jgi:glycosyltransferase involved in cell wall biosynthesis
VSLRRRSLGPEPEGADAKDTPRPRVLVVVGTYLPGVKGGGHIRSVAGLVEHLGQLVDFFIVCQDRDAQDDLPYPSVTTDAWNIVGDAKVMYLRRSQFTARRYQRLFAELRPDALYLNTVFSVSEVILPAAVAQWWSNAAIEVVTAPRGCLDPGALSLKSWKKKLFLRVLRLSRLPKAITWQASTPSEAISIQRELRPTKVVVASNLPMARSTAPRTRAHKESGSLRIIFLSRISPKKNLSYLLERLAHVHGSIELTVAGPIEDHAYWMRCEEIIARHLAHVRVVQTGPIPHEEVASVLGAHHVFALPTLGENFGHAIVEAFEAGVGVLISNQTPWHDLESLGAGWDLALKNVLEWEVALQACCDMDDHSFQAMAEAANAAWGHFINLETIKQDNLVLFAGNSHLRGAS